MDKKNVISVRHEVPAGTKYPRGYFEQREFEKRVMANGGGKR
jgi:hypothetical protein